MVFQHSIFKLETFPFRNEPPPVALDARIPGCSLNPATPVLFWEYVPTPVCMLSVEDQDLSPCLQHLTMFWGL